VRDGKQPGWQSGAVLSVGGSCGAGLRGREQAVEGGWQDVSRSSPPDSGGNRVPTWFFRYPGPFRAVLAIVESDLELPRG
jgi:hypothetical protein